MGLENVERLDYCEAGNLLTVTFKGGAIWNYHPVNPEVYAEIVRADSLHRAIGKVIRHSNIVGTKRRVG